jgi:hypothetical protein
MPPLGLGQVEEDLAGQILPSQRLTIGPGDTPIWQDVEELRGLLAQHALEPCQGTSLRPILRLDATQQTDQAQGKPPHGGGQGHTHHDQVDLSGYAAAPAQKTHQEPKAKES